MRAMLDLFAGFGGASEAFVIDQEWTVQRLDNNPLLEQVPFMTIGDVFVLRDELKTHFENGWIPSNDFELIWASVPCDEVSLGYSSARSTAARNKEDFYPHRTMALLEAAKEIIDMLKPKYWVIENVRGSLAFFKDVLGEPTQIIAQKYVLWGNFPHIICDTDAIKSKFHNDTWSSDPLRPQRRAVVPLEISRGLLNAINTQTTLFDFA